MWNWRGLLHEGRWLVPWVFLNGLVLGGLVYLMTYG